MSDTCHKTLIVVPCRPGQASCAELERQAATGEAPRIDYVMLARRLHADVIDAPYMTEWAPRLARHGACGFTMLLGQVSAAFVHRNMYGYIFAWGERIGLSLALLFKLARARRDLAFLGAYSSTGKRAALLKYAKVHSHVRAVCYDSGAQLNIAANRLDVPRSKLHLALPGVDEHFWSPRGEPEEHLICSVGSEARDYATLLAASQGLNVAVEVAVGGGATAGKSPRVAAEGCGSVITHRSALSWHELRRLYGRSRFVVVPTHDVEYNAGITTMKEAMAMGKAVIVTRSRGQVDFIRDGEQGIFVPPGDPSALRTAINYLLDHPEEAERMGRAGRMLVETHHTLDTYVSRLAGIVRGENEG